MKNYYENQLKKLTNFKLIGIKLSDYEGNQTNNMALNLESIQVLREFLDKLETKLMIESMDKKD